MRSIYLEFLCINFEFSASYMQLLNVETLSIVLISSYNLSFSSYKSDWSINGYGVNLGLISTFFTSLANDLIVNIMVYINIFKI